MIIFHAEAFMRSLLKAVGTFAWLAVVAPGCNEKQQADVDRGARSVGGSVGKAAQDIKQGAQQGYDEAKDKAREHSDGNGPDPRHGPAQLGPRDTDKR